MPRTEQDVEPDVNLTLTVGGGAGCSGVSPGSPKGLRKQELSLKKEHVKPEPKQPEKQSSEASVHTLAPEGLGCHGKRAPGAGGRRGTTHQPGTPAQAKWGRGVRPDRGHGSSGRWTPPLGSTGTQCGLCFPHNSSPEVGRATGKPGPGEGTAEAKGTWDWEWRPSSGGERSH